MHYLPQPKWDEKNKRWIIRIQINGKRKAFTSSKPRTEGKKECREKAAKWLEAFDTNEAVLFGEAAQRFLDYYHDRHGDSVQYQQHCSLMKNHILPKLAKIRMGDIRIEDYQDILSNAKPIRRTGELGKTFQKSKQLSKKYLKNIKNTITAFHKWAVARGYSKLILNDELYIPLTAPTRGKQILQLDQISEVFKAPVGLWYERALQFEILTGCRPGELLGLKIEDYDPITGIIHIRRAINAQNIITEGKNANARRDIALPDRVRQLVDDQIAVSRSVRSSWIFCQPSGLHGTQEGLRRCWRRICAAHGFPADTTPYSLRHTFYTHTEAFLPDRMIKMVFGHSEKTDGHAIYGDHVINGELKAAADMLTVTPIYRAAADS